MDIDISDRFPQDIFVGLTSPITDALAFAKRIAAFIQNYR